MFVIIFSSFNLTKEFILECSATIKIVDVCSIRKEIYTYLKKNPNCGFPLITNYLSKEDYKNNKNMLRHLYYKFTGLEQNYANNNWGFLTVYNHSRTIDLVLRKSFSANTTDKDFFKFEMNNLVIRICNVLLENISIVPEESFKKIRLVDKYINNFITHRSDCRFIYRLYENKEIRYPALSNEDLNELLTT